MVNAPRYNAEWDAGSLGCGELVVKLKLRFRDSMEAGQVIKVRSTDEGLPIDIPAWCSLTKNPLIHMDPPYYYIQKRIK